MKTQNIFSRLKYVFRLNFSTKKFYKITFCIIILILMFNIKLFCQNIEYINLKNEILLDTIQKTSKNINQNYKSDFHVNVLNQYLNLGVRFRIIKDLDFDLNYGIGYVPDSETSFNNGINYYLPSSINDFAISPKIIYEFKDYTTYCCLLSYLPNSNNINLNLGVGFGRTYFNANRFNNRF